jgi:integrase/recombinase XerD
VTTLIQRMREELVRRHYAESTIRSYLHTIEDFRRFAQRRLDHLGPDEIRRYQVYLLEERKLDLGTASNYAAALRFFYVKTLKRPDLKGEMPYPIGVKRKRRLPVILSQEEVTRVIDSSKNLFHYAMLLTIYSAGLRRSELCRLKVSNIDSQRMMLRVERGKGDVDREVPLSQKLLETLREYWRWMRPQTYLFPGTADGWRADKPITSKVVWEAVQYAAKRAGIEKHVVALEPIGELRGRHLEGLLQRVGDSGGHQIFIALEARRLRGCAADQVDAEFDVHRGLERIAGQFAVAREGMTVADEEDRAFLVDRQIDGDALADAAVIEVAAPGP